MRFVIRFPIYKSTPYKLGINTAKFLIQMHSKTILYIQIKFIVHKHIQFKTLSSVVYLFKIGQRILDSFLHAILSFIPELRFSFLAGTVRMLGTERHFKR